KNTAQPERQCGTKQIKIIQNSFLRRHYPDQVKGHGSAISSNLSRRSPQRPCVRLLRFVGIILAASRLVNGKISQSVEVAALGHGDEIVVCHDDVVCQGDIQRQQGGAHPAGGLQGGLGGEG